ncbi:uncharacterized protein HD556DRAFT_1441042 [Suillus plorans]|uniref:Uncharacterized protein n=1 Tax=Suillus plorans TaxID=116603 RepID=A0A9P7DL41_9AGAM|nr:uncharacterized protein HD556DRAFT_1441042 [Suillus plorans]KAG1797485.1 hypothetical protein HD556DRAFT_1441042 [Suillus plorans]
MRFSSAILPAIVAALASSSVSIMSAQADTAGADIPNICQTDEVCSGCAIGYLGVFCIVGRVSAFSIGPVWPIGIDRE